MSDKKGLAKHCEYLESKIRKKQFKIDELRSQLKQSEEVIDETIGMLDKLDTDIMQNTIIGFQQFLPRFYEIKEILQRYKGDNK